MSHNNINTMDIPVSGVVRDGEAELGGGGADVEEGDGSAAHHGVHPKGPFIKDVRAKGEGRGVDPKADIVREVAWI